MSSDQRRGEAQHSCSPEGGTTSYMACAACQEQGRSAQRGERAQDLAEVLGHLEWIIDPANRKIYDTPEDVFEQIRGCFPRQCSSPTMGPSVAANEAVGAAPAAVASGESGHTAVSSPEVSKKGFPFAPLGLTKPVEDALVAVTGALKACFEHRISELEEALTSAPCSWAPDAFDQVCTEGDPCLTHEIFGWPTTEKRGVSE